MRGRIDQNIDDSCLRRNDGEVFALPRSRGTLFPYVYPPDHPPCFRRKTDQPSASWELYRRA